MAHSIHSLKGIIINDRPHGEAGRILYILSQDLGIVALLAQGVREQKSKLRGLLSLGTIATFEFVEGREVKRLTTIIPENKLTSIFQIIGKRNIYSRIVQFLERVVVGEQENHLLYEGFLEGLRILESTDSSQKEDLQILEMAIIISVLHALGYWSGEEFVGYEETVLEKIRNNKEYLLKQINKAIESTHL